VAFTVAQSAIEQGLDALIVDVGGPVPTAIDGTLLSLLAIGPNREALLDDALDEVVSQLAKLPGVNGAQWDDTDEIVTITLAISEPIATLGTLITEVISGSDLNALLDRPLEVAIANT
jgi:predicted TIM-barrel enzyme